ncbi:immunoglobulin-like domain-containing protein [Thalassobellus suaedae]|uniref:LamG-like jellyroll fold domain-containing protein n=1 Tax=Thalassobellus suaedae TaxID=3074124 RepID=A0ABY9XXL3_9FLAO|nr:LamG-like jellyroll fold domain-containing protein [Flavobacteriaceae bacterium HL-DH14]
MNGQATVLAQYDFDSVQDLSGDFIGTLENGAELIPYGNNSILSLGNNDGYFNFGSYFGTIISQLDNFSISTNLLISSSYQISGLGNFVWTFANSTNMAATANGNIFFGANRSRYTISKTNYTSESSIVIDNTLLTGQWINLTYTQFNGIGKIYINGNLEVQGPIAVTPKELGATPYNFLGRSCYSGDKYLKTAQYDNFIVYNGELNQTEISTLTEAISPLNDVLNTNILANASEALIIPNADAIKSNLILNTIGNDGVTISWASSNTNVITTTGVVTRPAIGLNPVNLTLTATLQLNDNVLIKTFDVTVIPLYSDAESVQMDLDNLALSGNTANIRDAIQLPIKTEEGTMVVWTSDAPDYLNNIGKVQQLSPFGNGKKE